MPKADNARKRVSAAAALEPALASTGLGAAGSGG